MRLRIAIVLSAVFVLLSGYVSAQQTDSAYMQRFNQLHKTYAEKPADVYNLVQLAIFYFDNRGPMRSLPTAMEYAREAEARYVDVVNRNKYNETARLVKNGITVVSVRELEAAILDAARRFVATRDEMSSAEMSRYMTVFADDAAITRRIKQLQLSQSYDQAVANGTIDSYYAFIEAYPATTEAEEAEKMIAKLAVSLFADATDSTHVADIAGRYPLSPSVRRAAVACMSRLAFADTRREGTAEAYTAFMQKYPSSDEFTMASELYDAQIAASYASLTTPSALADFAEAHPDSPLADSAVVRLVQMVLQERNSIAAQVYLDRFAGDSQYDEVLLNYYSWHTMEGNADPIEAFIDRYGELDLPASVDADLDRAREADRYALNKPFVEAMYPYFADGIRNLMGRGLAFVAMQRTIQQQITKRDWAAAGERLWQFDMCFETMSESEYNELVALIKAPVVREKMPRVEFAPKYAISHPAFNNLDNRLYYTRKNGTSTHIESVSRQRGTDQTPQIVRFTNTDSDGLCLFGFFDGGKQMLLGKDGDIWIATLQKGQWMVTDIPPYPLNSDFIETDAYMLPDGSGMLLASDRPGGYNLQRSGANFHGDTALATDLYFVPHVQQGWGTPVNMGQVINTPYCERSPLISSDMQTLYFTTDSRGLGYGDIYTATRTSTGSWQNWTAPKNLGKEINTGFDEASMSFGIDENRIVYTTRSANTGMLEVLSAPLGHRTTAKRHAVRLFVSGMEGYLVDIKVCNLSDPSETQTIAYWVDTNGVLVTLPDDGDYLVQASSDKRYISPMLLTSPREASSTLKSFTTRQLAQTEQTLPLLAVAFDTASGQPTAAMIVQLQAIARFMLANPESNVELLLSVPGQDVAECYNTSVERAEALRRVLERLGVQAGRVHLSPYGNHLFLQNRDIPEVQVRFR
ncbi:MAG: hypothetical protein K5650_04010 [Bacteroidales bacterium]|nr:hypothetical protein [Bacteroidales bacterium]